MVGFGERFDAVDQRGRQLDAVVFEQYKAQGKHGRTYLPMPFAHVVGGAGWGFHVRTSRRTWYDVGTASDKLTVEVALGDKPSVDVAIYHGDADRRADRVPRRGRPRGGAAGVGAAAVGFGQRVEHPGSRDVQNGQLTATWTSRWA